MYGWKFVLYAPVYINEEFHHNAFREEIVHTRKKQEPDCPPGKLHTGYEYTMGSHFKVGSEEVYRVAFLGRVRRLYHWAYELEE
jgi:hypothetical protein